MLNLFDKEPHSPYLHKCESCDSLIRDDLIYCNKCFCKQHFDVKEGGEETKEENPKIDDLFYIDEKEMKQELKRECFKEKYNFVCCNCGYKQWAKPSMSMKFAGINSGHGSCLECKKFLHLEIEGGLDGEKMISMLWDDFLKKEGKDV